MKTFVSNSTSGRESLSPTSIKPFASARLGAQNNWLLRLHSNQQPSG